MVFDLEIIEEAALLTGIGMGTAFGLLVFLLIFTSITGRIANFFDRRHEESVPSSSELELERRQKALAAVIAVTALIENPDILNDSSLEAD